MRLSVPILSVMLCLSLCAAIPPSVSGTTDPAFLWVDGVLSGGAYIDKLPPYSVEDALKPTCHEHLENGDIANWYGWQDGTYGERFHDYNQFDAAPGTAWFGRVDSEIIAWGSFGAADIRLSLSDLPSTATGYYYLHYTLVGGLICGPLNTESGHAFPGDSEAPWSPVNYAGFPALNLSIQTGIGYSGDAVGTYEELNQSRYLSVDDAPGGTSMNAQYLQGSDADDEIYTYVVQEDEDRPFSVAEVNAAYIWLRFTFDQDAWSDLSIGWGSGAYPAYFRVAFIITYASPAAYTPPPDPGSFILRPNDDLLNSGWTNYSADNYTGCYGATNDTGLMGDSDNSYIHAGYNSSPAVRMAFTDVPDGVPATARFTITLWWVARNTMTDPDTYVVTNIFGPGGILFDHAITDYLTTSYMNHTMDSDHCPDTSKTWTVDDLDYVSVALLPFKSPTATPNGLLRITQVAILCTPTTGYADDLPPSFDPIDYDDVHGWLATGGGFSTILALMGALGMFLAAPFIAMSVREGRKDAWEGIVLGVVIFFGGLGFFLAGTAPWS